MILNLANNASEKALNPPPPPMRKISVKYLLIVCLSIVTTFFIIVGYTFVDLNSMDNTMRDIGSSVMTANALLTQAKVPTELEIVVTNKYAVEIAVYFVDGDSGMYLVSLLPDEESTLEVYTGQSFYATAISDGSHLLNFKVFAKKKRYILGPAGAATGTAIITTARNTNNASNLSKTIEIEKNLPGNANSNALGSKKRDHPYIIPMNSLRSTAHYAKFKYVLFSLMIF